MTIEEKMSIEEKIAKAYTEAKVKLEIAYKAFFEAVKAIPEARIAYAEANIACEEAKVKATEELLELAISQYRQKTDKLASGWKQNIYKLVDATGEIEKLEIAYEELKTKLANL